MKSRILMTLVCVVAFTGASTVQAADRYFWVNGGAATAWNSANWYSDASHVTPASKPTSGQSAQIDTDCYLDQNEACASFGIINSGVTLELTDNSGTPAGFTLTVAANSTSTIAANTMILLSQADSELTFSDNHTLAGSGIVEGTSNSAKVSIAAGKSLTLTGNITGALQIADVSGSATFVNQGIVNANATGTLLITADTVDDSAGTNRWQCTNANALLRFTEPSGPSISTFGPMQGQFVLTAGEIEINTDLTTTGPLAISGGLLDVKSDVEMGSVGSPMNKSGGSVHVDAGWTWIHN